LKCTKRTAVRQEKATRRTLSISSRNPMKRFASRLGRERERERSEWVCEVLLCEG